MLVYFAVINKSHRLDLTEKVFLLLSSFRYIKLGLYFEQLCRWIIIIVCNLECKIRSSLLVYMGYLVRYS